ncbi:MAG: response regulator [Actinomycetota bacterium]|nr:response regulator [Actinomycetota bacterium]
MSAGKRIVVAEDDRDIRDLVVRKLASAGHTVIGVGDGAAALAAVRREAPDLAVLDVTMPGMTGIEVCQQIRGSDATERLPVILLTARVQDSDVESGFSAGADDYVGKPFSPRELAERVAAVLKRASA